MGAFDDYPKKGGAFSDYKSPAPSSDIAQPDTLPALDPRTATIGDYLAKLHQAARGFGQLGSTAADYARVASNVYGEGQGLTASLKTLYGDITGPTLSNLVTGQGNDYLSNLAAEKAKTAEASQRLGTAGTLAASLTGGGPLVSVGKGISTAIAPYAAKLPLTSGGRWLGGVLGSGITGAGATTAGEIGRDEPLSPKDIALSGVLSAGGGMFGGVTDRGGALATPLSEDALRARATQEYAPLDEMVFHGPSQVKPALDAVTNTMTGAEKDLAKSTMAKVEKLGDQTLATGADVQKYQKVFGKLEESGSDVDREFAPQFKSALQEVLNLEPYGRNLTPRQGMSLMLPGQLGGTGFAAGDAAAVKAAGDVFHGRAEGVARLNDMIDKSKVAGGPDVSTQVSSWLRSPEGQRFAPPPAPGARPNDYTAYNTVAGTSAGPPVSGAPSAYDLRHLLYPIVPAIGAGMFGVAEGHDPSAIGGEMATAALLGYGVHKGVPWVQRQIQGPTQQRAIDALRSTLSTGNYQKPVLPDANWRDALRSIIFSQAAAGRY
jgi:hypothetical protein